MAEEESTRPVPAGEEEEQLQEGGGGGLAAGEERAAAITWTPYLWSAPKPATAADIQAVEGKLNVTFPEDYKETVMAHQGESPNPGIFRFYSPEQEAYDATPFQVLFHFVSGDEEHAAYHILSMYETLQDRLPEGVIPIGEDPGGSYVAFDYRVLGKVESASGPWVVYLDHEQADDEDKFPTIFLANSFKGFLDQLRSEEEIEAELEAAALEEGEEEEDEEEEAEGGEEDEINGEDDGSSNDDGSIAPAAKRRRNEEGEEDVVVQEEGEEGEEEAEAVEEEPQVGQKRKNA